MGKLRRRKKTALQGGTGHIRTRRLCLPAVLLKTKSLKKCFPSCSPLHLKSEPEDNYYSPKLEKSLKRERDDDNE